MGEEGREDSGVIDVSVIRSVATAAPINLTITPTEYSSTFGYIPPYDPATPNIATCMCATFLATFLFQVFPVVYVLIMHGQKTKSLLPNSVGGNEVVDEFH